MPDRPFLSGPWGFGEVSTSRPALFRVPSRAIFMVGRPVVRHDVNRTHPVNDDPKGIWWVGDFQNLAAPRQTMKQRVKRVRGMFLTLLGKGL